MVIYENHPPAILYTPALFQLQTSRQRATFLGSDPEYVPKKNLVFLWVHPPKKTHPQNPHFYFDLILVYTLYATNNAIFYCFFSS